MKKIGLIVALCFLVCMSVFGANNAYIETVKSISNQNSVTVERVVRNRINAGEFFVANRNSDFMAFGLDMWIQNIDLAAFGAAVEGQGANKQVYSALKQAGAKTVSDVSLKWKVEGKTRTATIVRVTGKNVYAKIPVYQDGDYLSLDFNEIQVYTNSNQLINSRTINGCYKISNFMKSMER